MCPRQVRQSLSVRRNWRPEQTVRKNKKEVHHPKTTFSYERKQSAAFREDNRGVSTKEILSCGRNPHILRRSPQWKSAEGVNVQCDVGVKFPATTMATCCCCSLGANVEDALQNSLLKHGLHQVPCLCAFGIECPRALVVEPPGAVFRSVSSAKTFSLRLHLQAKSWSIETELRRIGNGFGFTGFVETTAQAACVPPRDNEQRRGPQTVATERTNGRWSCLTSTARCRSAPSIATLARSDFSSTALWRSSLSLAVSESFCCLSASCGSLSRRHNEGTTEFSNADKKGALHSAAVVGLSQC